MPAQAGQFIQAAMSQLGVAPEWRALAAWEKVCGPLIASRTMPERFLHGVLQVRVAHSSWALDLTFVKADLLARLRIATGLAISDLRFVVGAIEAPDRVIEARALERPASASPPQALTQSLEPIGDPDLRQALLSLGLRVLEQEGGS